MCEIPRQAFLIAARDELQIPTRDASLRELVDQAAEPSPLAVVSLISGDPAIPFNVNRDKLIVFCPKPRAVLWEGDLELDSDRSLEQLVARCEELSRTKFVELLAGGEPPKAKVAEEDLPPPEHIERQLAEMDFVDQFAAVRALHRLIRERGESPRLLGALSQGYANLGLLTSCFMAPAHKVFFARSLLYAERLHARDHGSPWGLWRRAYARAITGLHAAALEDLEAADKAAEGGKIARPDWAGTIDAFCRFDERALSEAAASQPLAGVFLLKSLFGAQRHALVLSTAQKLLEDRPDCYFAIDSIYQIGSLGTGRMAAELGPHVAAQWLPKRLLAIDGLPEETARIAGKLRRANLRQAQFGQGELASDEIRDGQVELFRSLRKAGESGADDGEPSWGVLAALVEDVGYLHAARRALFYANMLDVPVDELLEQMRPLVADHPLRALIDLQSDSMERRREAAKALRASTGFTLCLAETVEPLAAAFKPVDNDLWAELGRVCYSYNDRIYEDLLRVSGRHQSTPETKALFAQTLCKVSPHAPFAVGLRIVNDWPFAEAHAAEWEMQYSHSPLVLGALGAQYQQLKRLDDAERCFKQAAAAAPDIAGYERLAALYWQKGDMDAWKETLDRSLELESYGLEHASTRVQIARYFMGLKEWEKALPYAEQAAQTGAAWAMLCEAACREGMQDWGGSERLIRFSVQRYADIPLDWLYFCKRTGKGDVEGAAALALKYIAQAEAKEVNAGPYFLAAAYILLGKHDKALPVLESEFKSSKNPSPGILAALVADRLDDNQTRDRLLAEVIAEGPQFQASADSGPRAELLQLAQWLVDDLKQGGQANLDLAALDKRLTSAEENERLIAEHFLGRYFLQHGKRDAAVARWKRVMGSPQLTNLHRTFAGACLGEIGIGPEDYQAELAAKPPAPEAKQDAGKQ